MGSRRCLSMHFQFHSKKKEEWKLWISSVKLRFFPKIRKRSKEQKNSERTRMENYNVILIITEKCLGARVKWFPNRSQMWSFSVPFLSLLSIRLAPVWESASTKRFEGWGNTGETFSRRQPCYRRRRDHEEEKEEEERGRERPTMLFIYSIAYLL